jgi:hypothetical protein
VETKTQPNDQPPASRVQEQQITVVVNGQPVSVQPGPVREVIRQAIEASGQIGAPIPQWELRTRDGEVIPHSLSDGGEWMLSGGTLLFMNLGLPTEMPKPQKSASRVQEVIAEAESIEDQAARLRGLNEVIGAFTNPSD